MTDWPVNDIIEWDVATWVNALDVWTLHAQCAGADTLEVGSRRGGLALWMALEGARSVVCSDLDGPAPIARAKHAAHAVADRVTYAAMDATALGVRERFDVVAFKSVLGGIGRDDREDRQRAAIVSMHAALKPGGRLLFAENLTGSLAHRLLRRLLPWGGHWRYVTVDEMLDFLGPFRRVEFVTAGCLAALGRSEYQRHLLAVLDQIVVPLTPRRWHYVIMGVAWK